MSNDPREQPLNDVARKIMVRSNYDPHFSGIEERVIMETALFLARYDALQQMRKVECPVPGTNFAVRVMYFADTEDWRIYDDKGDYWSAKSIEEIPGAIKAALWLQSTVLRKMSEMPDVQP